MAPQRGAAGEGLVPEALGIAASSCGRPRRRRGVIDRDSLVKTMLDTADARLVVVAAPAGYGKTTSVVLWDEADPRDFVWVHLDSLDDDPVHLARHIAAALDQTEPVAVESLRSLAGAARSIDLDLVPALGRVVAQRPPFVLVFDDVHLLTNPAAVRVIDGVLAYMPDDAQLAVVGRSVPAFSLARRRMSGVMAELSQTDLAMSGDEASQLFEQLGVSLAPVAVESLVRQTEGWAGGLHLAALALDAGHQPTDPDTFSGRHGLVADYLVQEVLSGLADETVQFLCRSAVFDRMNARLLDELLETDRSGEMLQQIETSGNLFLVPLDSHREWYRYHHLFGEMLRAHLHRVAPAEAMELERRASLILEAAGELDGAIRHAVAARDMARAADLILQNAAQLALQGRVARLGQWLDLLGERAMDDHASAALAWAWYGLALGDEELITRSTTTLQRSTHQGPLADGSPSVQVAVAAVRMIAAREGLDGVLRDSDTVLSEGADDNPWWAIASAVQGTAYSMLGDLERADERLAAALPALSHLPTFDAGARAHRALLAVYAGDLAEADRRASAALRLTERYDLEGVLPALPAFAVASYVAARHGRIDEAERAARATERMLARLGDLSPRTGLLCYVLLGKTAVALGDRARARVYADEADRVRQRDPSPVHVVAQLHELGDQLESLGEARLEDAPALTPAELRVLVYLPTHLALGDIAERLYVSRNTVKSHAVAIYRKLGVSSRNDAVSEARRLGLLDGAPS
jgi:LuxR family maltose regulon positive regulatory protein